MARCRSTLAARLRWWCPIRPTRSQGDFSTPKPPFSAAPAPTSAVNITGGQLSALLDDKNNVLPSYVSWSEHAGPEFGRSGEQHPRCRARPERRGARHRYVQLRCHQRRGHDAGGQSAHAGSDRRRSTRSAGGKRKRPELGGAGQRSGLNGYTFAQFYGNLGGQVGNDVSSAQSDQSTDQSLLNQAQTHAPADLRRFAG